MLEGEPLYFTDLKTVGIATSTTTYNFNKPKVLFSAIHTAGENAGNLGTLVNWSALRNDGGGSFASGIYTVPEKGTYRLHISLLADGAAVAQAGGLHFNINGVNRLRLCYATAPVGTYDMAVGEELLDLNKGDLVKVTQQLSCLWFGASSDPVGRWNIELIQG